MCGFLVSCVSGGFLTSVVGKKYRKGIYTGEMLFGVPYGQGKLVLPDGTSYDGGWRNGEPHGEGTFVVADGH